MRFDIAVSYVEKYVVQNHVLKVTQNLQTCVMKCDETLEALTSSLLL